MNSRPALRGSLRWLAATGACCLCQGSLASPHLSFLDPQGPIAASERTHFWLVIALMMIAVLPVLVLTPILMWRYRYGADATYRPRWSFSWPLEFLIWGGPFVIVLFLGYMLWTQTIELDPYKPIGSAQDTLHVDVVGYDWKWLFIYPDQHIATVGTLVIPAGRPVAFKLTSATVLQTFFIPALGSQIDVMNRMVTQLHLKADDPGRFMGRNMQYSGDGFYHEHFVTEALDAHDFAVFVQHARQHGVALNERRYALLERRGSSADLADLMGVDKGDKPDGETDDKPSTVLFSSVPAQLFAGIVRGGPLDWGRLESSASASRPSADRSSANGSSANGDSLSGAPMRQAAAR